jgi:tetratricopeptide (TPR) repeat protein
MKVWLRRGSVVVFIFLALLLTAASQDVGDRIQQLYAEAQNAEKEGRANVAIEKYRAIITLNPKLAAAHNNLGRLYFQQSRLEEAIRSFKRACELDPNLEAPRAQMGLALFQMGDFVGASNELQAALRLNPVDRNAKLGLARSLVELGNPNGALGLLDQLQQEQPRDVEVLYTLAMVHTQLAESAIGEIAKVDPDSYLIEVILGKSAEVRRAYSEAAEHYQKAIAKSPNAPGLCYLLAHALWEGGDLPHALEEYRRSLELDPYDYNASWEAARIVLPDNPEEAFRLANRALELKPSLPGALTIRARALLSLGKPREAIEDLKRASALDQEDATIHFHLARAYRELGLTAEAASETAIYDRMQERAHTPN